MKSQDHELKQRLEELEIEQNRLNQVLNDVEELDVKIHKLNAKLPMDNITIPLVLKNNEEIANHKKDKETTNKHLDCVSKLNKGISDIYGYDIYGYVVCLMFNPQSPPEWSGKEWHIPGKGKCYHDHEQAYQCLQQLQERWPNYPFQVLERNSFCTWNQDEQT